MLDAIATQRMIERGIDPYDVEQSIIYQSIASKPRYLDKPPKRISMSRNADCDVYGCKSEFIQAYNATPMESIPDVCYIKSEINNSSRQIDKSVYVLLTTLATQSFTNIKDRSEACFFLFREIVMSTDDEIITPRVVYNIISRITDNSYYVKQLIEAISICMFAESEIVLEWLRLVDPTGFYNDAIVFGRKYVSQNFESVKEMKSKLAELYAEAKEDEDFMNNIYKPGANKYLIPIIWALRKKHPEVLKPGTGKGGFAD